MSAVNVILSDRVIQWFEECHRDPKVRDRIRARFYRVFDRLERFGMAIGMPYVRKIRNLLWEARVDDSTGAYRAFFGLAPNGIVAVACGGVKKADQFPPEVYDRAEQEVLAFISQIESHLPGSAGEPINKGDDTN